MKKSLTVIGFVLTLCFFTLCNSHAGQARFTEVYNPAGIRPDGVFVDELLAQTMKDLGKNRPQLAGHFPAARIEKVSHEGDLPAEVNELFYRRGWSDGLPIVPPTKERVKEMLKGTDLSGDFLIATLDPMGGQATVEKIAVNAVMAGCRPEYMPVLIAAVEIVADPQFNLRGLATTTNPDAPMLILSGPLAKAMDINAGTNALGRGWKANSTISRALHLIIQNIGGSWPGITDMSCLGHPGEFSMMLADNDEANPWQPLRMDLGYPRVSNVLTIIGAEGTQSLLGLNHDSVGFLNLVADNLAGMDRPSRSLVLLIIAQDTAKMLARDGWNTGTIAQYIKDHARLPFHKYKPKFLDSGLARLLGGVPSWVFETKDPDTMIPTPFLERLLVLVSGGPGEKSMIIPGWIGTDVVSREIRLPGHWADLLEREKNERKGGDLRRKTR